MEGSRRKSEGVDAEKGNLTRTLAVGDNLADVDSAFEGMFLCRFKVLSNGIRNWLMG